MWVAEVLLNTTLSLWLLQAGTCFSWLHVSKHVKHAAFYLLSLWIGLLTGCANQLTLHSGLQDSLFRFGSGGSFASLGDQKLPITLCRPIYVHPLRTMTPVLLTLSCPVEQQSDKGPECNMADFLLYKLFFWSTGFRGLRCVPGRSSFVSSQGIMGESVATSLVVLHILLRPVQPLLYLPQLLWGINKWALWLCE